MRPNICCIVHIRWSYSRASTKRAHFELKQSNRSSPGPMHFVYFLRRTCSDRRHDIQSVRSDVLFAIHSTFAVQQCGPAWIWHPRSAISNKQVALLSQLIVLCDATISIFKCCCRPGDQTLKRYANISKKNAGDCVKRLKKRCDQTLHPCAAIAFELSVCEMWTNVNMDLFSTLVGHMKDLGIQTSTSTN